MLRTSKSNGKEFGFELLFKPIYNTVRCSKGVKFYDVSSSMRSLRAPHGCCQCPQTGRKTVPQLRSKVLKCSTGEHGFVVRGRNDSLFALNHIASLHKSKFTVARSNSNCYLSSYHQQIM